MSGLVVSMFSVLIIIVVLGLAFAMIGSGIGELVRTAGGFRNLLYTIVYLLVFCAIIALFL